MDFTCNLCHFQRIPMYENAQITRKEGELLVLSYITRYSATDKQLEDLLELLNLHMPRRIYPSKYLFLKNVPKRKAKQTFYCTTCQSNLSFETEEVVCECGAAHKKRNLLEQESYFLILPLYDQLHRILYDDKVRPFIQRSFETSNVTSGRIYKYLVNTEVIGEKHVTLLWNSDGAKVFNSAMKTLWLLLVAINELPYNLQKSNMMLVGLWMDKGSPRMNNFLKAFVEELVELNENGIICEEPDGRKIRVKVHCILSPVDSVARPKVIKFNNNIISI